MGVLQEKEIRAYQLKDKKLVCPVCATDEEKAQGNGGRRRRQDPRS